MGLAIEFYDALGNFVYDFRCGWFWEGCPEEIQSWIFRQHLSPELVAKLYFELVEYRTQFQFKCGDVPEFPLKILEKIDKSAVKQFHTEWSKPVKERNYGLLEKLIAEIRNILWSGIEYDYAYENVSLTEIREAAEAWSDFNDNVWDERGYYDNEGNACWMLIKLDYIIEKMWPAVLENYSAEWSY